MFGDDSLVTAVFLYFPFFSLPFRSLTATIIRLNRIARVMMSALDLFNDDNRFNILYIQMLKTMNIIYGFGCGTTPGIEALHRQPHSIKIHVIVEHQPICAQFAALAMKYCAR